MFGLGILKGLRVTFLHLFREPVTVQYPDRRVWLMGAAKYLGMSPLQFMRNHPREALQALIFMYPVPVMAEQSSRFRGNEFTWYEERCTGCASCAKYCPLGIIKIVTSPGGFDQQEGESYSIDVFDIDAGRCMFCGLCVEACPYDALHMGTKFERGKESRQSLVISKEELNAAAKSPSSWYRPQLEQREYDPYNDPLREHKRVGRHEMPDLDHMKGKWVDRH